MIQIKDQEKLKDYLRTYQLESVFSEELTQHLTLCAFDEGDLICEQGDPASYLNILVKGKVKIYTSSQDGHNHIFAYKSPLEVVGDIEFIQNIEFMNTVEAVTPVVMIRISYNRLHEYGNSYPPFLHFLLRIITRKFNSKNKSTSFNLMYPVEVRLASYILSVSIEETGKVRTNNLRDVADLIGTSYRHLNRVIHHLVTEGLIERTKEFIVVKDYEGLSVVANHTIYE